MFLIDDLVLSPAKGLLAICRRVRQTAREEYEKQQRALVADLAQLHRRIETNGIEQNEFDSREAELLEKLETIQQMLEKLQDE